MDPRTIRVRVGPELYLAALEYAGPSSSTAFPTILACHGWMDNAASFHYLAPALAAAGYRVICLELPGHGHSDHRPPASFYIGAEYAANIIDGANELGMDTFLLLGHSLGGGLSTLVAAALPDRCLGVVLIDNAGPSTRPVQEGPKLFASSFASTRSAERVEGSVYPSIDAAVDARLATVARYDKQYLSREAAERLVVRGTEPAARGGSSGVRFRHDRRIAAPSLITLHEEQVLCFLRAIKCPVLLLRAEQGWPVAEEVLDARLAAMKDVVHLVRLPGGHHLHADPTTQAAVVDAVLEWLTAKVTKTAA